MRLSRNRNKNGSRPIKICVVVASPDIIGGHSVQASRLVRGLSAEPGIEVQSLWINPRLPRPLRRLQRIKYVRTLATLAAYILTLITGLWSVDVVHVFSASYWSFLLGPAPALIVARLYRKPVVLNYHSGEAADHLARWRRIAIPILNIASVIVVPSRFLVEIFAKFNLRAIAIPNTVDLDSFRFRRRDPLEATLLCNRNLEANYDVSSALKAFALVQKEIPCIRLVIAGDGSQAVRLRGLAAGLGLRNVDFLGAVDPLQMPAVYEAADIFVNSSVVDCMPLSILEAFACGLPVVTTCAGGIPYIVRNGENGLLVEPGNHLELAQAVLAVLRDADLAGGLVEQARRDCNQYTWEAVRPNWLAAYHSLICGERVKPGIVSPIDAAILSRSGEAE